MKRQKNLIGIILIMFVCSLGLMSFQNAKTQDSDRSVAWKAPINQGYAFYLKGLLKHLQLDMDYSGNEEVIRYDTPTHNLPIMILPIK